MSKPNIHPIRSGKMGYTPAVTRYFKIDGNSCLIKTEGDRGVYYNNDGTLYNGYVQTQKLSTFVNRPYYTEIDETEFDTIVRDANDPVVKAGTTFKITGTKEGLSYDGRVMMLVGMQYSGVIRLVYLDAGINQGRVGGAIIGKPFEKIRLSTVEKHCAPCGYSVSIVKD